MTTTLETENVKGPEKGKWYKKTWLRYLAVGLTGLVIGSTGANGSTPTPEVVTETVTKTETVEVTPQSCTDALTTATQGFDIAAAMLMAVGNNDTAAVTEAVTKLEKINKAAYQRDVQDCFSKAN